MKVYLFTETCIDARNVLITPHHYVFKTKEKAMGYLANEEQSLIGMGFVFKKDVTNLHFAVQKDYVRNDEQVRLSVVEHEVVK